MKILITGGTGLIGRRLAAELVADGHEVVVLTRRPERADLPPGVEAAGWDGRTSHGWGPLVDGDTALVNLAGENIAGGRWTTGQKKRIRESRLDAGRAVVEAVGKAPQAPRVLLQASAVGYYGPRGDAEVTEQSPAGKDFLASVCAAWEDSTAAVEERGVRRVVLRTGVVLDPEGGALPKMMLPFKLFAGGPAGDGEQWMPWIHAADEIAAIRFLLDQEDAIGPYNLTAPHPVTNGELSRALGKVLHRPALLRAPAFALRLALGEMADVVLTGQRALPRRLLEAGFRFRFPEIQEALRDLLG